jgi:N-acetylmuramic acid 6-phosphate etherase
MNPASTPAPTGLVTESASAASAELDLFPTEGLIDAFVDDQLNAVKAVRTARADLVRAVQAAVPRIAAGGRLIYVGAGTSGRLGLLDSVELYPTFSWPKQRAIALLAGGSHAVLEAVEGAEDDFEQGAQDLRAVSPSANDVVLLLAASGRTPYALGALQAARGCGALTIAIANNPRAELTREAEIGITLDTGPEVIAGSTRLKAGTSQKIALNSFSSALMVGLNKVYGNLMVDLQATNQKLKARAVRIVAEAAGADEAAAAQALAACDGEVKVAIVSLRKAVTPAVARTLVFHHDGSVRQAVGE